MHHDRPLAGTTRSGSVLLSANDLPSPERFLRGALLAIFVVVTASAAARMWVDPADERLFVRQIFWMTWVDAEQNIPTMLSFALLCSATALLIVRARLAWVARDDWRLHWTALFVLFSWIAFDEAAQMHERLVEPLRERFDPSGPFLLAWVMVALPAVVAIAVAFVPFLLALPRLAAFGIIASGLLYVGGALGMEMVAGAIIDAGSRAAASYHYATMTEETLEMLGVALFVATLLAILHRRPGFAA